MHLSVQLQTHLEKRLWRLEHQSFPQPNRDISSFFVPKYHWSLPEPNHLVFVPKVIDLRVLARDAKMLSALVVGAEGPYGRLLRA